MKKNNTLAVILLSVFCSFALSVNAQVVPCQDRLMSEVDFAFIGGSTPPERWSIGQANAPGFSIDEGAFTFVASGNMSNQNVDFVNHGTNWNTNREYAIVQNPHVLNPGQFANIPPSDSRRDNPNMLVINPLQGQSDQFAMFTVGGLIGGQAYYLEMKVWNVLDLAPTTPAGHCHAWCNWNSELFIDWRNNQAGAAHSGLTGQTWTGTNGTGSWSQGTNQVPNIMRVAENGAYAIVRGRFMLPANASSVTLTLAKGGNSNPIVLGIEYIRIFGCQAEAITTHTGVVDGGRVCETSELRLTAQGLGPAGSTFTWTQIILNGPEAGTTVLPGTGRTIAVTTPAGRGTRVTYRAQGLWATSEITVETQLCCYDTGDIVEVLRYSFPMIPHPGCTNPNRGWISGADGVRIDPLYHFVCTGGIWDENSPSAMGPCGPVRCAGGYAVIRDTGPGDGHFGGWTSRPIQERTAWAGGETGTGMLVVNAAATPGVFFEFDLPVDAICGDGSSYQFSAWFASADPNGPDPCNVEFQLIDIISGNIVERVSTGNFGYSGDWMGDAVWNTLTPDERMERRWRQVTMVFTTAPGEEYMVRLVNNGTGVSGNDVLIDDILITRCLPNIDFFPEGFPQSATEAVVCSTDPVEFKMGVPTNASTPSGNFSDLFPTLPTIYFQLQVSENFNSENPAAAIWNLYGTMLSASPPYLDADLPSFFVTPTAETRTFRVKITADPATAGTLDPPSPICGVAEFLTRVFHISLEALDINVAQNNFDVCHGETVNLIGLTTENPEYAVWGWARGAPSNIITPGGLSNSPAARNFSIANAAAADSGTYYFVVQRGTCEEVMPVTVSVGAALEITNAEGDARCGAGTLTLTATGTPATGTINWFATQTSTAILGTGSTWITPSISTTTSYWVAIEEGGCSSPRVEVIATIDTNLTIRINNASTAAFASAICYGESIELTAAIQDAGVSATSWTWTPATNLSATNVPTVTANPTATTTYTITVMGDNGCEGTATAVITVNPLPAAPTAVNVSECYSGSTFTGNATVAAGQTVVWFDAATGGNEVSAPSRSAVGTTTAWAETRVTATGCASATRTEVTATVRPVPTITTFNNQTVVFTGESLQVTGSPAGGTWTWTKVTPADPGEASITNENPVTGTADINGLHSGNIIVTYNLEGCTTTVTLEIRGVVTGNDSIINFCPGETTHQMIGYGQRMASWTWYRQGTPRPPHNSPLLSTDPATQTRALTATELINNDVWIFIAYNGEEFDEQRFTLSQKPTYTFTVEPTNVFACVGEIRTITATNATAVNPVYTWTGSGTPSLNVFTVNTAMPSEGTITVTGVDDNTCVSAPISINYLVTNLNVNTVGTWATYICRGETTTFQIDTVGTGALNSAVLEITWESTTTGANWTTFQQGPNIFEVTVSPQVNTQFRATVRTRSGANILCTRTTPPHSLEVRIVTVGEDPPPYRICVGEQVTLVGSTPNGLIWWWEDASGNQVVPPSSNPANLQLTLTPTSNSVYYFVAQAGTCVSDRRQRHSIEISDFELILTDDFSICPEMQVAIEAEIIDLTGGNSSFDISWTREREGQPAVSLGSTLIVRDRPNVTTTYTITVDDGACERIESVTVSMNPVPTIVEVSEIAPRTAFIDVTGGTPPYMFAVRDSTDWFFDNIFGDLRIGWQYAYVIDSNNCRTSQRFFITEVQLEFPSFFTPNSDGQNDRWVIGNLEHYQSVELRIFDRFGRELAFITDTSPESAWDGTYRGRLLPSDDYWYLLYLPELRLNFVGHFTLINAR